MFKEDWGEQFVGKHYPVLCMLDIVTGEITVVEGVPDNVSPGLVRHCLLAQGNKGKLCLLLMG